MKKVILTLLCTSIICLNGNTQVHKHAMGIRITGPSIFRNSQLNYQLGLNEKSRLDFGLNFNHYFGHISQFYSGVGSIYYQRVWNIKNGLNWFLGAGVNYAFYSGNHFGSTAFQDRLGFGPQIGLEYDFNQHDIPLILSIDARPSLVFSTQNFNPGFTNNLGFSVKYAF